MIPLMREAQFTNTVKLTHYIRLLKLRSNLLNNVPCFRWLLLYTYLLAYLRTHVVGLMPASVACCNKQSETDHASSARLQKPASD